MSDKHLLHRWTEAVSSKPYVGDSFKRMHLSVLHHAVQRQLQEGLLSLYVAIDDFLLYELKGEPATIATLELPDQERDVLWMCLQFQGSCMLPNGVESVAHTLFTFVSNRGQHHLTLPMDEVWILFLGVSGASRQQVMSEYGLLRQEYSGNRVDRTVALPITNREWRALEMFSKAGFGSFTTLHHIGLLYGKCFASYVQQLERRRKDEEGQEASLVSLYRRAIAYVQEHYMQASINRITIAEALNCSTRHLSRAFEGRPVTIGLAILLMRLYKGRELLRNKPHLSIEQIAGILHFSDAKHFAKQYKKYFHHSPRQARKDSRDSR